MKGTKQKRTEYTRKNWTRKKKKYKKARRPLRKAIASNTLTNPQTLPLIKEALKQTDLQNGQDVNTLSEQDIKAILDKYNEEDNINQSRKERSIIQRPKKLKILESRSKRRTILMNNIKILET